MGNDEASSFPAREAELFEQALDKTGAEREAFLQEIGMSDPAKSDVSALAGRPIRVRMAMRDADIYSLRFEP